LLLLASKLARLPCMSEDSDRNRQRLQRTHAGCCASQNRTCTAACRCPQTSQQGHFSCMASKAASGAVRKHQNVRNCETFRARWIEVVAYREDLTCLGGRTTAHRRRRRRIQRRLACVTCAWSVIANHRMPGRLDRFPRAPMGFYRLGLLTWRQAKVARHVACIDRLRSFKKGLPYGTADGRSSLLSPQVISTRRQRKAHKYWPAHGRRVSLKSGPRWSLREKTMGRKVEQRTQVQGPSVQ
jgi:hypothetical protein